MMKKQKNQPKSNYEDHFDPELRAKYWEYLYKDMERRNMKLERQAYIAGYERDEWRKGAEILEKSRDKWRKLYEETLSIAVQKDERAS